MECSVVKDLLPLYLDGCCSEESKKIVEDHLGNCAFCRKYCEEMKAPADTVPVHKAPDRIRRISDWKASVLQSMLLFLSFAAITVGVALEARTPTGFSNGVFALNLVVPATGFMLSLANWYFVKLYKSRRSFSNFSCLFTFGITLAAYFWAMFHYELFSEGLLLGLKYSLLVGLFGFINGPLLTLILCILSKILSGRYAAMMGKE